MQNFQTVVYKKSNIFNHDFLLEKEIKKYLYLINSLISKFNKKNLKKNIKIGMIVNIYKKSRIFAIELSNKFEQKISIYSLENQLKYYEVMSLLYKYSYEYRKECHNYYKKKIVIKNFDDDKKQEIYYMEENDINHQFQWQCDLKKSNQYDKKACYIFIVLNAID
jgi:hypothetical protein